MGANFTPLALARLGAPLRRLAFGGMMVGAIGACLLVLAVPAWLARLGLVRSPLWVPLAWLGLGAIVVVALAAAWRVRRRLGSEPLARAVEGGSGWRRGAVTSVLQGSTAGTSEALYTLADQSCASHLDCTGADALGPLRAGIRRRSRVAVGFFLAGGMLLFGVRPFQYPAAALWSPARAWGMFVAPVQLRADRTSVDRGETVALTVRAAGRPDAELWLRGKGESWRAQRVPLDSAGRALERIGPLTSDLYAFVRAGGRTSDTLLVEVRLPVFLGRVTLTAHYPAYLGLEDESLPATGDTLLIPAGTRIEATGEATADLATARWTLGPAASPLSVKGPSFRGTFLPRASGLARLELTTEAGAPLEGDPIEVPIVVVPDQAPIVDLPVPEPDTTAVLGTEVALVVDARDDHGLEDVSVQARRAARGGRPATDVVTTPLPLPAGTSDRALLAARLDFAPFGLEPGDTLSVWVVARDNAPTEQTGRSRTLVLVVPTETEARAEQRLATSDLAERLDSLVSASRQLQRLTDDLSRERQRSSARGARNDQSLGFEEARRAEQVAKEQQELLDRAGAVQQRLEEMERSADKAGIADSAFLERLAEIRAQLDKALTPELRQKLQALREALKNLDSQGTKDALKELADAQERLKEALERSRDLFKRAALEGELSSLEQETKEVLEEQQRWNEQVGRTDSTRSAAAEQRLAERTDSVGQGLLAAAKQLEGAERQEALQQAAEQTRQAAQAMRQASQSAKAGKSQQAKQQGEQAAQQLSQAGEEVKEQRESQQDEWRQEVLDALDRALAETARLSRRQLELTQSIGRNSAIAASRAQQAAIEEGVQKILSQVAAVSGKNALISPQIGAALSQARGQMSLARDAISSASANLREAQEQAGEAVDALNVAAYLMLRSRDDVSGSSSASGLAEALERMQQMAGKQGSLSQQGNTLLSMLAGQQLQRQIQLMAERQRQIAQEMERLRAASQIPGAKELGEEARELARKLEAGRLDRETVERQERLFKRMLDAGRTLQGEEEDEKKERQAEAPKSDSVSVPAALRRLLDPDGRVRFPTWEELQRLSPEERRLVTDYFRRLASRGRR